MFTPLSVPGRVIVILSPSRVGATVFPGLVRSSDLTFPETTWWFNTAVSVASSISVTSLTLNAASRFSKAVLVGAKTVKGPSPLRTDTKSVFGVPSVRAVTSGAKVGSATAKVTTVGMSITASTAWMIPLVATISAAATELTPFNVTPLSVFT